MADLKMVAMGGGLGAPPRRVRLRREAWGRVGWGWAMMALLVFQGSFLTYWGMVGRVTLWLGREGEGRVVAVRPLGRAPYDGVSFAVTYTYDPQDGGIWPQRDRWVNTGRSGPVVVGQLCPLRVLRVGGWHHAEWVVDAGWFEPAVGYLGMVMAGWGAVCTRRIWVRRGRERRLVGEGEAGAGVVMGKDTRLGRRVQFEVRYRFRGADGVELVSRAVFEGVAEGQVVTVLYRAGEAGRSRMYEAMDYEVVREGER